MQLLPLGLFVAGGLLASACIVRHPLPDLPPPEIVHETRRHERADGTLESEVEVRISEDGRSERDGFEREYHANGQLVAERFFARGEPIGLWRCWYADGTPRSEVDFRAGDAGEARLNRFWHPNGALAAEGPAIAGVREGRWRYFGADGQPRQEGAYRAGKRDGPWVFYGERGAKRAEGVYALGDRVGVWTLWDAQGQAHERPAAELEADEP
jgi:antitoxin component YwqK of YwqJK toxin-antitoxin module